MLNVTELRVLTAVARAEQDEDEEVPISALVLGRMMGVDQTTVTSWADRLVLSGYLLAEPLAVFMPVRSSAPLTKAYRLSFKGSSVLEEESW